MGALVLLGAAYAVILAIDEPPLDGRSAIVGALLLAVGELGYLSLGARSAVTDEAGTLARRIAWVMTAGLLGARGRSHGAHRRRPVPHRRARGRGDRGGRGRHGRRPARARRARRPTAATESNGTLTSG